MRSILITLFYVLICFPALSFAEQGSLIVGISHWPPWKDTENQIDGIDIRILDSLAKKLQIKIIYQKCPWIRCQNMIRSGQVDMVTSYFFRQDRNKYVKYISPPYAQIKKVFFKKKGNDVLIKSYDDFEKYRIGITKGAANFAHLKANQVADNVQEVTTSHSLVKMLLAGRLDLILESEENIDYWLLKESAETEVVKLNLGFSAPENAYLAISRESSWMKDTDQISNCIADMIASGEVNQIRKEYFTSIKQNR